MKKEKNKILVADDEKDILELLTMLLTAEGYEVVAAHDGKEAVELVDATVDLCILDVNMPEMNGFSAAAEIRKQYYMPIIFLTAYSGESEKMMGYSAGADDYMVKPFSIKELLVRVSALIRRVKKDENKFKSNEIISDPFILNIDKRKLYKVGISFSSETGTIKDWDVQSSDEK